MSETEKLAAIISAAEALLAMSHADTKAILEGLANRPGPGAKKRAREAFIAHLKALGDFRDAVSSVKGIPIVGSAIMEEEAE